MLLEAPRRTLGLIESSSVWQDIGSILFEELQQGVCLSVVFLDDETSAGFFSNSGVEIL